MSVLTAKASGIPDKHKFMDVLPEKPAVQRRDSGFTLIELLVVIAVIGILAAILVPAIAKVRESGRIARSTSNLRQIGVSIQLYAQDNNGVLPVANDPDDGNKLWIYQLWPYSNPGEEVIQLSGHSADILDHTIYYTPMVDEAAGESRAFGFNGYLKRGLNDRLNNLDDTVNLALVGDTKASSALTLNQINFRNRGKANVLFADGHVALTAPSEVPETRLSVFWEGNLIQE